MPQCRKVLSDLLSVLQLGTFYIKLFDRSTNNIKLRPA